MAHSNARRNERNLIRTDFQYNYTKDSFKGVDFSSPDGRCDDAHFAYLVNLYRDKGKTDGAALESVPGYRMIRKNFEHFGDIYGIYSHGFLVDGKKKTYLLVHKGAYLYSFSHDKRDTLESLTPIAELSCNQSFGFAYGGIFYILDGERILAVKSPTETYLVGDSFLTEEEKMAGTLPESTAYIPLTHRNGEAYEARNLLSGFFEIERTVDSDALPDDTHGLFYKECYLGNKRGLEVCGMEACRRIVAIPESALLDGEELPIFAVAPNAFEGREEITTAVLAPSVRVIGASAFRGCLSLKQVLIHGEVTIGELAFADCRSLKTFACRKNGGTVDTTAFDGCSALSHLFFEANEASPWMAVVEDRAVFHPRTLFYWQEQGTTLYIPCSTEIGQSFHLIHGTDTEVLFDQSKYHNYGDDEIDLADGISAKAGATTPYVQYVIVGETRRYAFVSVFDRDGRINTQDEVEGFRIVLPKQTKQVASVSLDGVEIQKIPDGRGVCYACEYSRGILSSLRVLLPKNREGAVQVRVRCYSETEEATKDSVGVLYDAIRACRFAAVFDGRIFLGGNPALPDTVFYSVAPKQTSEALMFASTAKITCRDTAGEVSAFAVHPLYLAVIKNRSLYGVTRTARADALHEVYEIQGWCASPLYRSGTYTFGDEPLFLSEGGVMALTPGKAWEEGRIENRSYYIDAMLRSLESKNAAFAEWNGYLALLLDGKIFLADSSVAEKKNGVLAYEWYFLDGIGHYDGQTPCYHHLSHEPFLQGRRLSEFSVLGRRLYILGEEVPVTGEVFSTVFEGITLYYTVGEDGRYYLVDSYGEMEGGLFSPAKKLLSAEGCLYFSTSDGYLFCFNSDKRGKTVLINDMLESVAPDEIHESYYTFDGRRYPSRLITGNVDMGVPHLLKSTAPRSLVVRAKTMPHSAFTVSVCCDGGAWVEVGFVVANRFDIFSAERFSFSSENTVSEVLADNSRGWLAKQVMISAEVFQSPIGLEALAYRYRMAGRARTKF